MAILPSLAGTLLPRLPAAAKPSQLQQLANANAMPAVAPNVLRDLYGGGDDEGRERDPSPTYDIPPGDINREREAVNLARVGSVFGGLASLAGPVGKFGGAAFQIGTGLNALDALANASGRTKTDLAKDMVPSLLGGKGKDYQDLFNDIFGDPEKGDLSPDYWGEPGYVDPARGDLPEDFWDEPESEDGGGGFSGAGGWSDDEWEDFDENFGDDEEAGSEDDGTSASGDGSAGAAGDASDDEGDDYW